jgi:DNA/RNA endonuclease YhcR with UshA esterase domain
MRSIATVILALGLVAACHSRADETNSPALTIGGAQAADYIGKQVTVTGVVAQVSMRPGLIFLNFDKAYPSNTFTVIVRSSHTNEFENLPKLKGKSVAVKGKVVDYNGKAEIELTKKSQLTVPGETK